MGRVKYNQAGYVGCVMSKRAVEAYAMGEKPRSKWTKHTMLRAIENSCELLGIPHDMELGKLKRDEIFRRFFEKKSWHHTGKHANPTDFYRLRESEIIKLGGQAMKRMGHEVLQALKTRNAINRANPGRVLQYKLRNINVNGEKHGCSGHVTDLDTGACVYIDTERSVTAPYDMLYRQAKDEQDFTSLGMVNNWANTLEELVEGVTQLLGTRKPEEEEQMARKQVEKKEEPMAEKNVVKFEKANVWIAKDGEVAEVPGYRFKFEMNEDEEVYVGLVKVDGGWALIDTYTGTTMAGMVYRTRDVAAEHFFDTVVHAYRKVFMNEMHEAKASDFSKKVLRAKGFESKGEYVKKAEEKLAERAKRTIKKLESKTEEPEVVVAIEALSFIDGNVESAEKAMEALRKLTEGGNVVVRWKGKPMAPIRVEGNTKPYQKKLKEAGLRWARKGFWYLKPTAC